MAKFSSPEARYTATLAYYEGLVANSEGHIVRAQEELAGRKENVELYKSRHPDGRHVNPNDF